MKKAFILVMSFFIVVGALAQNTTFTYQGRVTDNGTNFTGIGQFEFALSYVTNTSSQATAVASSVDFNGAGLNGITVTYGGSGYVTAPAVTITSTSGSGAAATAVLSGGSVSSINITAEGGGYYLGYINANVSIAPPPANYTNITLWSNDGTPSGEPAAAVSVPVTNGLFSVILGNTTLSNMTAVPAAVFTTTNSPQLEIWFNDGVHGFSALTPLQNVTPAPLAAYASSAGFANTASNLLGELPTSQLTGTVPAGSLTGVIAQSDMGTNNSYTPTIGDGTHNFTTGTQSGYYTVVGNLVHVEIWLKWSSKGSASSGSAVQISLPYAVASDRAEFTIGYFSGLTYVNQLVAGANNAASSIFLDSASNSGGSAAGLTVANCGTGGEIQISGTYRWQ